MTLYYLPLIERVKGFPLRDEIKNVFPESVTIRVDIDTSQSIVSAAAAVYAANIL